MLTVKKNKVITAKFPAIRSVLKALNILPMTIKLARIFLIFVFHMLFPNIMETSQWQSNLSIWIPMTDHQSEAFTLHRMFGVFPAFSAFIIC